MIEDLPRSARSVEPLQELLQNEGRREDQIVPGQGPAQTIDFRRGGGRVAPEREGPDARIDEMCENPPDPGVLMEGQAVGHTHPKGEINICFAWAGEDPRFDGHPAGWVVFPPGSHHVPTVTGGQMLFVYFMPGGEVVWDTRN